jgi:hypothetical protein
MKQEQIRTTKSNNEFVVQNKKNIPTYVCNKMRVFSASEHVESIPLATSMRDRHFSLILKTVFDRNVPTSSSCIVVNTLAMVDGGTLMSYRRVVSLSSS